MIVASTCITLGISAIPIRVEVSTAPGIPQLIVIGLASKTVAEAKERVKTALKSLHLKFKQVRTIVNLAPADIPKHGSSLDLALAVGLIETALPAPQQWEHTAFFGELSLDGEVQPIKELLSLFLGARSLGFTSMVIPYAQKDLLTPLLESETNVFAIGHMREWIEHRLGQRKLRPLQKTTSTAHRTASATHHIPELFDRIVGQSIAKRCLVAAAVGHHHLLMIGPPGVGKTLLAQSSTTFLPPLTHAESVSMTQISAAAGEFPTSLISERPFRSPHHSIAPTRLMGGGVKVLPGELSRAHGGVLFLDELSQFKTAMLEQLRQPLEMKTVSFTQQGRDVTFPCDTVCIAATNPCVCGWLFSKKKKCRCTLAARRTFHTVISGPLRDRFDLQIFMDAEQEQERRVEDGEAPWRARAEHARARQGARYPDPTTTNGSADWPLFVERVALAPETEQTLKKIESQQTITHRNLHKMLRVARTLADLDDQHTVFPEHILEALYYRDVRP